MFLSRGPSHGWDTVLRVRPCEPSRERRYGPVVSQRLRPHRTVRHEGQPQQSHSPALRRKGFIANEGGRTESASVEIMRGRMALFAGMYFVGYTIAFCDDML